MNHVLVVLCTLATPVYAQQRANAPDAKPPAAKAPAAKTAAAPRTPRTADGHPDLSGVWGPPGFNGGGGARVNGSVHDLYYGAPIDTSNPETDAITTRFGDRGTGEDKRKARLAENKPVYKPEFEAKVEMMGHDTNHYDPTTFTCQPAGVPRMGEPGMIVQTPGVVVFLYGAKPYSTYRVIPTDGRPHRKGIDYDPGPMGDPVGHWEGDTFVVETTGFDADSTWFAGDGAFHSEAMKVTERFTRKGDTLEYTAVVEDPQVLAKPFNVTPKPKVLKLDPKTIFYNDDLPCDPHDFKAHADHENHL